MSSQRYWLCLILRKKKGINFLPTKHIINQILWRNISYHLSYTVWASKISHLLCKSAKCYFTTRPNYFQTYLLLKHGRELWWLKNFTNHNEFYILRKDIYGQYIIAAHDNKLLTTSASLTRHKVQKPYAPRCTILLCIFFFVKLLWNALSSGYLTFFYFLETC